MYSKEELLEGLKTTVVGRKLFLFDSIDSTNACAKTLAEADMEEGAVVFADFQTEGRGRLGRSWLSEPGNNLLFSCIFRPSLSKERAGLMTFFAAVSAAKAIETMTHQIVECKWPNDLLLGGKKCCGILLENSFTQDGMTHSVVGIGVNVNQEKFEQSLQTKATSLKQVARKKIDRKELFQAMLYELETQYGNVVKGNFDFILNEWNRRCTMFGKTANVVREGGTITGKALELSPDGGLVLETATGTEIVYAGDVTVLT
ncbi:MAG: biotin--[acetyl-CoA-carboxylase] ligase [Ignavibacteriae bacterium]|nr:biotin--[acetyl-CoA-carboxylase] ligase [Ignavibacteriota bacterium]